MRPRQHVARTRHLLPVFLTPQHSFPVLIALLLAVLAVPPSSLAHANIDTVTNCSGDLATIGSLPAMLAGARGGDTITFAQDCTDANAIVLTDMLSPAVNVTIDATVPLHTVTVSGGGTVRLFALEAGIILSLQGLTLVNGVSSSGLGGAIFNTGGILNVSGSTFYSNTANVGGAIYNLRGMVNVVNSTFSGNALAYGLGGAIFNFDGAVNVVNSTFSGNTATYGGAIYNGGGALRLVLSVVAGNTAGVGPDIYGTVTTDGGGNAVGDTTGSGGLTAQDDKLNVNPLLAPLARNSGPVQTFALLSGSPAIDIAVCPIDPITMQPLATDARGIPRPQGTNCDAGSYEASSTSS